MPAGETFGNYRVVKCISEGLMVNYYHMQHVRDFKDVILGLLHPRACVVTDALQRLEGLQQMHSQVEDHGRS